MKKLFTLVLLALLVFNIYSCIPFESKASTEKQIVQDDTLKLSVEIHPDSLITIVAVGDIMLGTNFPNDSYLPPSSVDLLKPMHPYFKNRDVVFGNLEGTILNKGGELKKCKDSTLCYAFRQPEYLIDYLKNAQFNMLSVANNHVGDFGEEGRRNTQKVLKEKGFRFAGQVTQPYDTMTVKGVKIGMIAFSPNSSCLRIEDLAEVKRWVSKLDSLVDVIIVSFHGGAEGTSHTHVTRQTEIFYEEDRGNVYEFARVAIDAGADVILGHGPHVPRAVDLYKNRFITYSMGNFCTYARFNLKGPNGIAPLYEIRLSKDGALHDVHVVSTKQLGEGGPLYDPTHAAYNMVRKLTQEDFPEMPLEFLPGQVLRPRKL